METGNIKEILFLMDQSLKQLEGQVDGILENYYQLKKDHDASQETFLEYKERTLRELKELKVILDNESSLYIAKNIKPNQPEHNSSMPLTILMSESDL